MFICSNNNNKMKKYNIVIINTFLHKKNKFALQNYKNMSIQYVKDLDECENLDSIDCVYNPACPMDVSKYPNIKFVFGPHFSVFPEVPQILLINKPNSVYIQPSQWAVDIWKLFPICNGLNMKSVPFGVDTERFAPNGSFRKDVFIYFKSRKIEELIYVTSFLSTIGLSFRIFNYSEKYNENEYLQFIQRAKFGIWIGRHESQGFALEEALACNVPLLVWDVTSMNQEEGYHYPDFKATCIPYWDKRCGEYFYNKSEFISTFQIFFDKIDLYAPREYILQNLTMDKCCEYFEELFTS